MTDDAVRISITIKVEDVVMEIQEKVPLEAVEECVHSLTTGLGQQVLHGVIQVLDDRIARQVRRLAECGDGEALDGEQPGSDSIQAPGISR